MWRWGGGEDGKGVGRIKEVLNELGFTSIQEHPKLPASISIPVIVATNCPLTIKKVESRSSNSTMTGS